MNRVRGMTIKQFNEILNDMRQIYNFRDEFTSLDEFQDLRTGSNRQVCIHTIDDKTGVEIVLCKGADWTPVPKERTYKE
jgi:hypothetical protein